MTLYNSNKINKYISWSIPIIFAFSSLMHFIYNILGKSSIIGIIAPVNESVWEHLKMPVLPIILFWVISYFILKDDILDCKKWLFAGALSLLICITFITIFYYTYTGIFGIKSTFLDILSLLIGISLGQLLSFKTFKDANIGGHHFIIVFTLFIIILSMFIVFTFETPHLPIFLDPKTNQYGIQK